MRIRSLNIDGFGKFADFDCGPFEGSVTVFQGANEAGKSTLLAFIRRVLFGFPDGRRRRNLYSPMAGGRHGGSVTLVSDEDEVVTVRRFSGTGGGVPSLSSATGEPIPATELPNLLGNHSISVFEHVFSFSLDELHANALLQDERINVQIYSAGMGATRLPGALHTLDQNKRELFLKGGRKHAIYESAGEIERIDARLREVRNNAEQYGRLSARFAQIESELSELRERRQRCRSELGGHHDLKRAWDDWNDLRNAERRLQELPEIVEFPENGVGRLETLDERAAEAREELESASQKVQSARERVEIPIEDAAILQESAAVSRLQRARNSFDQSVRDLPQRKAELEGMRSRLGKTLAELGRDWTIERLAEFDSSIEVREEVSAHGDRLREASENLQNLRSDEAQAQKALDEASRAFDGAQAEWEGAPHAALDAEGIRARRLLLRGAKRTVDEYARASVRADDLRHQLGDAAEDATRDRATRGDRALAATLAVAGVAGLSVAAFLGEWATGAAVAVVLLAAAAFVHFRTRSSAQLPAGDGISARIRRQADDAERQSNSLSERLAELAGNLGIESVDVERLDAETEALDDEEARLAEWTNRNERLEQAKTRLQGRRTESNASAKAAQEAETALQTAENNWRQWLAERKLQKTFSPRNIEVLWGRVDLGRNQLDEVKKMEGRIADIRAEIDRFVEDVLPIAEALGLETDANDWLQLARTADALIETHANAKEQARARETARNELRVAKRELAGRKRRMQEVTEERDALLRVAGVESAEEFRQRAAAFVERQGLEEQVRACDDSLRRIRGAGAEFETLKQRLTEANPSVIAEEIERCEAELEALDQRLSEFDTELGSVTTEREQLLGEEESSRLRAEGHRLREQIDGHARAWAVLTVAENLLKEARGRFERERRPDVLRHSEGYFSHMTGGRYRTVFSPLGSSEIHVTDDDGVSKQPAQLSRGTREQLFLSLRFGLIRELGGRSERLPVIVDEALVNFDADRGARAAHAFTELADQNQVLAFTCHQEVVDWFVNAAHESGAECPTIVTL